MLPLFQDLEEHIFYSPLQGYKAYKPFVTLGFTPLKKFAQQEVSPKGRASTKGIQQKSIQKEEKVSTRSPPKVERHSSPGEKLQQSPDTSSVEGKINTLKNQLALDTSTLQKEDQGRVVRVENYEQTFCNVIDSQNQSLDQLWGEKIKLIQTDLRKGNDELIRKKNQQKQQLDDLSAKWDRNVRDQNEYKGLIKDKTGRSYQQEPSTIVKGGISTDGMKVIQQYVTPNPDKNVQQQLA